jgi:hypothetical protein
MHRHYIPDSPISTVKLFPRLGPASVIATQVRIERPATRERITRVATARQLQNDRTQMRARLLRMILDNERVRRHDHHPNAS